MTSTYNEGLFTQHPDSKGNVYNVRNGLFIHAITIQNECFLMQSFQMHCISVVLQLKPLLVN